MLADATVHLTRFVSNGGQGEAFVWDVRQKLNTENYWITSSTLNNDQTDGNITVTPPAPRLVGIESNPGPPRRTFGSYFFSESTLIWCADNIGYHSRHDGHGHLRPVSDYRFTESTNTCSCGDNVDNVDNVDPGSRSISYYYLCEYCFQFLRVILMIPFCVIIHLLITLFITITSFPKYWSEFLQPMRASPYTNTLGKCGMILFFPFLYIFVSSLYILLAVLSSIFLPLLRCFQRKKEKRFLRAYIFPELIFIHKTWDLACSGFKNPNYGRDIVENVEYLFGCCCLLCCCHSRRSLASVIYPVWKLEVSDVTEERIDYMREKGVYLQQLEEARNKKIVLWKEQDRQRLEEQQLRQQIQQIDEVIIQIVDDEEDQEHKELIALHEEKHKEADVLLPPAELLASRLDLTNNNSCCHIITPSDRRSSCYVPLTVEGTLRFEMPENERLRGIGAAATEREMDELLCTPAMNAYKETRHACLLVNIPELPEVLATLIVDYLSYQDLYLTILSPYQPGQQKEQTFCETNDLTIEVYRLILEGWRVKQLQMYMRTACYMTQLLFAPPDLLESIPAGSDDEDEQILTPEQLARCYLTPLITPTCGRFTADVHNFTKEEITNGAMRMNIFGPDEPRIRYVTLAHGEYISRISEQQHHFIQALQFTTNLNKKYLMELSHTPSRRRREMEHDSLDAIPEGHIYELVGLHRILFRHYRQSPVNSADIGYTFIRRDPPPLVTPLQPPLVGIEPNPGPRRTFCSYFLSESTLIWCADNLGYHLSSDGHGYRAPKNLYEFTESTNMCGNVDRNSRSYFLCEYFFQFVRMLIMMPILVIAGIITTLIFLFQYFLPYSYDYYHEVRASPYTNFLGKCMMLLLFPIGYVIFICIQLTIVLISTIFRPEIWWFARRREVRFSREYIFHECISIHALYHCSYTGFAEPNPGKYLVENAEYLLRCFSSCCCRSRRTLANVVEPAWEIRSIMIEDRVKIGEQRGEYKKELEEAQKSKIAFWKEQDRMKVEQEQQQEQEQQENRDDVGIQINDGEERKEVAPPPSIQARINRLNALVGLTSNNSCCHIIQPHRTPFQSRYVPITSEGTLRFEMKANREDTVATERELDELICTPAMNEYKEMTRAALLMNIPDLPEVLANIIADYLSSRQDLYLTPISPYQTHSQFDQRYCETSDLTIKVYQLILDGWRVKQLQMYMRTACYMTRLLFAPPDLLESTQGSDEDEQSLTPEQLSRCYLTPLITPACGRFHGDICTFTETDITNGARRMTIFGLDEPRIRYVTLAPGEYISRVAGNYQWLLLTALQFTTNWNKKYLMEVSQTPSRRRRELPEANVSFEIGTPHASPNQAHTYELVSLHRILYQHYRQAPVNTSLLGGTFLRREPILQPAPSVCPPAPRLVGIEVNPGPPRRRTIFNYCFSDSALVWIADNMGHHSHHDGHGYDLQASTYEFTESTNTCGNVADMHRVSYFCWEYILQFLRMLITIPFCVAASICITLTLTTYHFPKYCREYYRALRASPYSNTCGKFIMLLLFPVGYIIFCSVYVASGILIHIVRPRTWFLPRCREKRISREYLFVECRLIHHWFLAVYEGFSKPNYGQDIVENVEYIFRWCLCCCRSSRPRWDVNYLVWDTNEVKNLVAVQERAVGRLEYLKRIREERKNKQELWKRMDEERMESCKMQLKEDQQHEHVINIAEEEVKEEHKAADDLSLAAQPLSPSVAAAAATSILHSNTNNNSCCHILLPADSFKPCYPLPVEGTLRFLANENKSEAEREIDELLCTPVMNAHKKTRHAGLLINIPELPEVIATLIVDYLPRIDLFLTVYRSDWFACETSDLTIEVYQLILEGWRVKQLQMYMRTACYMTRLLFAPPDLLESIAGSDEDEQSLTSEQLARCYLTPMLTPACGRFAGHTTTFTESNLMTDAMRMNIFGPDEAYIRYVTLAPGEYISQVIGERGWNIVYSLQFTTNLNKKYLMELMHAPTRRRRELPDVSSPNMLRLSHPPAPLDAASLPQHPHQYELVGLNRLLSRKYRQSPVNLHNFGCAFIRHQENSIEETPPASRLVGIELNPGPTMSAAQLLFTDGLLSIFAFVSNSDWLSSSRTCSQWYHASAHPSAPNRRLHRCMQLLCLSKGRTSPLRQHLISLSLYIQYSTDEWNELLEHLVQFPSLANLDLHEVPLEVDLTPLTQYRLLTSITLSNYATDLIDWFSDKTTKLVHNPRLPSHVRNPLNAFYVQLEVLASLPSFVNFTMVTRMDSKLIYTSRVLLELIRERELGFPFLQKIHLGYYDPKTWGSHVQLHATFPNLTKIPRVPRINEIEKFAAIAVFSQLKELGTMYDSRQEVYDEEEYTLQCVPPSQDISGGCINTLVQCRQLIHLRFSSWIPLADEFTQLFSSLPHLTSIAFSSCCSMCDATTDLFERMTASTTSRHFCTTHIRCLILSSTRCQSGSLPLLLQHFSALEALRLYRCNTGVPFEGVTYEDLYSTLNDLTVLPRLRILQLDMASPTATEAERDTYKFYFNATEKEKSGTDKFRIGRSTEGDDKAQDLDVVRG